MAGKKLMNMFFKVVDDEEKVEKTIPQSPSVPLPVTPNMTASAAPIQEDMEIKKQLADALEKANVEGYDYFELVKTVDAQAAIIPSEALRFQASYASATVMGVTVDKLISSAQFYLSILSKKEEEFKGTVAEHLNKTVTSKEDGIKRIDEEMQQKAEKIKAMTDEINAIQQKKTEMVNEISSNRAQIEQINNRFYATYKVFTDKITSDIEKIKTYLIK